MSLLLNLIAELFVEQDAHLFHPQGRLIHPQKTSTGSRQTHEHKKNFFLAAFNHRL